MKTAPQPSLDEILVPYSPEVRSLVQETRAFLRKTVPKAVEQVGTRPAIIGFGLSSRYADMICSIMPNKTGVTLGIARGTELPDPGKLLQGAGKVHRHVKIKSKEDLQNPALKSLLHAAIARREKTRKAG